MVLDERYGWKNHHIYSPDEKNWLQMDVGTFDTWDRNKMYFDHKWEGYGKIHEPIFLEIDDEASLEELKQQAEEKILAFLGNELEDGMSSNL